MEYYTLYYYIFHYRKVIISIGIFKWYSFATSNGVQTTYRYNCWISIKLTEKYKRTQTCHITKVFIISDLSIQEEITAPQKQYGLTVWKWKASLQWPSENRNLISHRRAPLTLFMQLSIIKTALMQHCALYEALMQGKNDISVCSIQINFDLTLYY